MFGKSKKRQIDEADVDESLDEEDEEEVLEKEQIRSQLKNRPQEREAPEPSPLSKQEVGELIDSNIKRIYELFNFYRQMK